MSRGTLAALGVVVSVLGGSGLCPRRRGADARKRSVTRALHRAASAAIAAVAAVALIAPSGAAAGTLDQQQTSSQGVWSLHRPGDMIAMTFTAGLTGRLDSIEVEMARYTTSLNPITVEIHATTASGAPDGVLLASSGLAAEDVPYSDPSQPTQSGWVPIGFADPPAVMAGTRYAFVIRNSADAQYGFPVRHDLHGTDYTGGEAWVIDGLSGEWQLLTRTSDLVFKTYVVEGLWFGGFASPIDEGAVNTAKAGATIPVRWHVENPDGTPVSDPESFVSVTSRAGAGECAGLPADAVEDYAGGSGLHYLGDGDWQFNWKVPKSYAGQCRTLILTLSGGAMYTAAFQFK